METVIIQGKLNDSKILVNESVNNISDHLPDSQILIITDSNVNHYYADLFKDFIKIVISPGEASKTFTEISKVYAEMVHIGVDRSWFILGVGGGVVTDIAGFISATYMRGLNFGFISTSLLGQIDASIGGKNGINFNGIKNIIGTIRQPEFVICDPELLNTLPEREIKTGIAEIIKYALITDHQLFQYLNDHIKQIVQLNKTQLSHIIQRSITIKANVVNHDEHEISERKKLNFGHTFGHAIERISSNNHGESVSIGMILASKLSLKYGYIDEEDYREVFKIINQFGLPTDFLFDKKQTIDAIKQDKKRSDHQIDFILLEKIGNALIKKIPIADLDLFLEDI
jgi:3-dehydroquinate synthase